VPVTVSRNAAASSTQHSPTILAQTASTPRHATFTSPLRPRDSSTAGGGSSAVPRKISFDFFGGNTKSSSPAAEGPKVSFS
jgi:hypothetical protein